MSAGPANVPKAARIVTTDAHGNKVVLREGNNGFTCMPGDPKAIGQPPMCADAAAMQWQADFEAHKAKPTNTKPGIICMLAGATQRSDTDSYDTTSPPIPIGPHWMIMWPFDPKTTGLPTKHKPTGRTSCGPDHPTPTCTSWDARRKENSLRSVAFLILITAVTYAQMPASRTPKSDADKIASVMQAGPKFVTQNATVLDWPSSPGGEFRVLQAGTIAWTCLPGIPQGTLDEPGCFDQVFLQFMKDSIAGRTPNVQSVGISYMYTAASGCQTNRMRWEAARNSTLVHTS